MNFWKIIGKTLLSIVIFPFAAFGGLLTGLMMSIGLIFVLPIIILSDIWGFDVL